ncbi:unnamed protein product [Amoebophrya sp. A25]|nr:unnamed protein product [Amoebophrya sp. A25]|eukprot:GSA25T00012950001.1
MDRVRNGDNTINDAFFEVLDKVMEIRRNCQLRTNNFTGGVSGAGASALKLQAEMMQQASTRDAGASSAISSAGGQTHHMGGHALLLNTSSAFDVLQETSDILDIAYERLFISVQQHCRRGFSAATASGVSGINFGGSQGAHLMKRSLQYLKERPVYFNHCLRDIAKMRKQMLNTRFHEALSRGGEDSHAIEMCKQYDPVRYVGDILAWIHENIATEREALTTFLGISAAGKERKKALRQQVGSLVASTKGGSTILDVASRAEVLSSIVNYEDAVSNDDGLLADLFSLLDFVLEGVCDSFKSRMDSLLHLDSLVGCYKISRLLAYFSRALTFLLNKDARLLQLINLYQQKMAQRFLDVCDANSQTMRGTTSNANTSSGGGQDDPTGQGSAAHGSRFAIMDDLSCPLFVREAVKMMHEIVQDVDSLEEFQPILCAAYDPLLNHCRQMFSSNPEDRAVFLINCISLMLEPLKTLPLAQDRAVLYSQLIQEQQMYLIEHQGQETLQKLGLLEKVTALRDVVGYPEKFPDGGFPTAAQLQQVPELHAVSLSSVLRSFYTSLFTLKALSVPHVEKISARELREETRKAVGRKILEAYIFLHDGLQALQVTTHTKDQVAMLLLGA